MNPVGYPRKITDDDQAWLEQAPPAPEPPQHRCGNCANNPWMKSTIPCRNEPWQDGET